MKDTKYKMVDEFITQVRGETFEPTPGSLHDDLKLDRMNFMQEELNEFWEAETIEDQMDALIDLQYFLLGTMFEMGISQGQYDESWSQVHNANMRKKKGPKNGRTTLTDDDAGKPDDWTGPDYTSVFPRKS